MKRFASLAIWMVLLAAGVSIIAQAQFTTDMSAFLPRDPSPVQRVLVDQIRDGTTSRLLLVAVENAPIETSIAIVKAMNAQLSGNPAFVAIRDGEISGLKADGKYLWTYRYLLSPAVTEGHFSADKLHSALLGDLDNLSSAGADMSKQAVTADPTGEMMVLYKEFTDDQHMIRQDGVWVDAGRTMALLIAETKAPGSDLDAQEAALAALNTAFDVAKSATPGAEGAHLSISGPGVFGVHARAAIKRQTSVLSAIASAMVAALLLAAYRKPRILLLAFLPVGSGVIAGIAAVALGFGKVQGITVGFGVTLIGEAVDYAIYYFTYATGNVARLWPILRLGMSLSVAGFAAMLFSGFTGFAQLGLFTIAGLVTAFAVTRFVLPVLTIPLPAGEGQGEGLFFNADSPSPNHPSLRSGRSTSPAGRGKIPNAIVLGDERSVRGQPMEISLAVRIVLTCGIVIAAVFGLAALHRGPFWQDDITSLSPASSADLALDKRLRQAFGSDGTRYFALVRGDDLETVLQHSETLIPLLEDLKKQGSLQGYDSPALILPSERTQRARQAALPDAVALKADLQTALQGLPFRPDIFAPFLASVETARSAGLVTVASLAGTSLQLNFGTLVAHNDNGWTALTVLKGVRNPDDLGSVLSQAGAAFVDLKAISNDLLLQYRREALTLAACGYLAMTIVLLAALRRPARVAAVLLPLGLAVIMTTALCTLGTERLSIFTLFGLLLTVAVGSNYCLFFERRVAGEPLNLAPLVIANLCTLTGFGILSFSAIPVLHGIGGTVAIGAFLSLVFGALLIPPRRAVP